MNAPNYQQKKNDRKYILVSQHFDKKPGYFGPKRLMAVLGVFITDRNYRPELSAIWPQHVAYVYSHLFEAQVIA